MNKFLPVLLISLFHFLYAHAQSSEVHVGFSHKITSQTLGATIEVQVALPTGYNDSLAYPVIYLLDGQRFFLYGASLQSTYRQYHLTPEFIVVGITTPYPGRFGLFSSRSDQFIDFIKNELFTTINENYRVTDERLLFGWEYGGSLAFKVLTNETYLFDGYLMASPFPVRNQVDNMVGKNFKGRSLVFSVSPDEHAVNHGVNKLDSLLSTGNISGLEWTHLRLSDEVHRSTPYPTLYHGIKQYYNFYQELQIDNLDRFLEQGGLRYAYDYNEQRSLRYSFPKALSTWTKYTILRSAMRADDYTNFSQFSTALDLATLIPELSDNRIDDLANYLIKNSNFDGALICYKTLLEKHPESATLLNKIANIYEALGNTSEAQIYLRKAAAISEQ